MWQQIVVAGIEALKIFLKWKHSETEFVHVFKCLKYLQQSCDLGARGTDTCADQQLDFDVPFCSSISTLDQLLQLRLDHQAMGGNRFGHYDMRSGEEERISVCDDQIEWGFRAFLKIRDSSFIKRKKKEAEVARSFQKTFAQKEVAGMTNFKIFKNLIIVLVRILKYVLIYN